MTKEKHLYRIWFLVSIFLLLINDFYLKFEYHNYLTGKLSDFVGLFAFPYFVSCFFPKRIKLIYIFTGALFVIWKSEFSQPIFEFAHSYGIGINRTVDYADLISLIILPISYLYWNQNFKQIIKPKKILKPIIMGICFFSFIATSVADYRENLSIKSEFSTNIDSDFQSVKKELRIFKKGLINQHLYKIEIPKNNAHILTSIKVDSLNEKSTTISLDSILSFTVEGNGNLFGGGINDDDIEYVKKLSTKEIEELFFEQLRSQLKEK